MLITKTKPLVSICIPTFNSSKTILETLESVAQQNYHNIEILIVDNASSDNTLEIAEGFPDSRIKIHTFTDNIGAEGNFNRCINLAVGEYIAIYHADDIYRYDIVSSQVEFLETHLDVGAVFTEADLINLSGDAVGFISFPKDIMQLTPIKIEYIDLLKLVMKHFNFLVCPTAMVRSRIYKIDIKEWRGDNFGSSSDLDVWLRIARNYSVGLIPKRLMSYRIGHQQYSYKVRHQTEASNFFKVIEYYLAHEEVMQSLNYQDFENYQILVWRDLVMRAGNFYLRGEYSSASMVLSKVKRRELLATIFKSKRSLMCCLLMAYLTLTNVPGTRNIGRFFLEIAKKKSNK